MNFLLHVILSNAKDLKILRTYALRMTIRGDYLQDYRDILRSELSGRATRNPNYSQRAFSRDIRITPNRLSEILNGKQGLSRPCAMKISKSLGMNDQEQEFFCDLVDARHARSKAARDLAMKRLQRQGARGPQALDLDHQNFDLISNWYHLAILELIKISESNLSAKEISVRLEISEAEAKSALFNLEKLNLIKLERNQWKVIERSTLLRGGVPSKSVRSFHDAVLQKATHALHEQPLESRMFFSNFTAVPKKLIPELQRKISEFICELTDSIEIDPSKKEDVYAFHFNFFQLSKSKGVSK